MEAAQLARAGLLSDLIDRERIVAIVGLAKNTGKTVCLNRVIEELGAKGRRLGVTSIGRDGEKFDAINADIEKPPIRLPAGTLVSSTRSLLESSGVLYTIVRRTEARTAMGEVVLAELKSEGTIEVVGPSTVTQLRRIADSMLQAGVDQVLVDGAFNRKASCSPILSDVVILSTGAALDRDPLEVVAITSSHLQMLSLPLVDAPWCQQVRFAPNCKTLGVTRQGEVVELRYDALRAPSAEEVEQLRARDLAYLVVKNSLTEAAVDELKRAMPSLPSFVVQDSSRLFVSPKKWRLYEKLGLRFLALRPTRVACVTINPVCPAMYSFQPEQFLQTMRGALEFHRVFDLLSPSYQQPRIQEDVPS